MTLQNANVGDEVGNNLRPCLVQRLVPNTRPEALEVMNPAAGAALLNEPTSIVQYHLPFLFGHEIHLVDQNKNPCLRTVLLHCLKNSREVIEVLLGAVGLDIKHVNKQLDGAEDGLPIPLKVGLIKGILAAAIPQVQDEIAEETDVMMLNVEGRGETHGVPSQIVGKDDASH